MKNTGYHQKNRRLQYQVAGTILVVACLGFAMVYFWQRYETKQREGQQASQETEKEDTVKSESVSAVVEPKQQENIAQETDPEDETVAVTAEPQPETADAAAVPELHFNGELDWPLEGEVLISYSMDKTVYFPTLQQYKYNPAMVIAGEVNEKVLSAAPGKVTAIETSSQTGCTVTVDLGDGYQAIYGQLKEVPLSTGDTVEQGTTIGYISEPTKYYSVEGSNLYFQLKKDGESKNPLDFLGEESREE